MGPGCTLRLQESTEAIVPQSGQKAEGFVQPSLGIVVLCGLHVLLGTSVTSGSVLSSVKWADPMKSTAEGEEMLVPTGYWLRGRPLANTEEGAP